VLKWLPEEWPEGILRVNPAAGGCAPYNFDTTPLYGWRRSSSGWWSGPAEESVSKNARNGPWPLHDRPTLEPSAAPTVLPEMRQARGNYSEGSWAVAARSSPVTRTMPVSSMKKLRKPSLPNRRGRAVTVYLEMRPFESGGAAVSVNT
jgi:hypothetical protein